MKKIIMVMLALIAIVFADCNKDSKNAPAGYECISMDICGHEVNVCSNGSKSYYEYNGRKWECNGTNCSSAAEKLVDALCDYKSMDHPDRIIKIENLVFESENIK
ncbi:MAG: hypothetical protein B7C24_12770 [Bacteroidetes bacterium 4572_77]|nr:MAG: hypothetical protein B7C24_12770 [Bacteroidetes bacterium 4572_77]